MEYSALIFENSDIEKIKKTTKIFIEDEDCKQIVVCCSPDLIVELALSPMPKTMLVKISNKPYIDMLNGLKAIKQENVLVVGLKSDILYDQIQKTKKELEQYPAIYYSDDLQAFDTRLVMFCLQMAIEINLAINTYAKAVELLGDTPLKYIN